MFRNTAKFLNQYNEIRHENIAYSLLNELNINIVNVEHFHHYGMDSDNSIKIGCYTIDSNDIFPIFSKPSYYIDLFRLSKCSKLTEHGKYIVPHGWGKYMTRPLNICCDFENRHFIMGNETFDILINDNFYKLPILAYRDYERIDGENGFLRFFIKQN